MKLKTTLNGQTFAFRDIRDVLAKANEPKAADRLQGVAAETVTERVAAKIVLSELTVGELTENPTVPYEKDEVTRVNLDGLNQPTYQRFKGMTIGELRGVDSGPQNYGGRPGTQLPGLHRRGSGGRGQAHVRHGSGLRRQQNSPHHPLQHHHRPAGRAGLPQPAQQPHRRPRGDPDPDDGGRLLRLRRRLHGHQPCGKQCGEHSAYRGCGLQLYLPQRHPHPTGGSLPHDHPRWTPFGRARL